MTGLRRPIEPVLLRPTAQRRMSSAGPAPNLVVNGGFDTDTDWTKGTGWTITGGVAVATNASGQLSQNIAALVPGVTYRVEFTLTVVSGSISIRPDLGTANGTLRSANGTYVENIVHAGTGVLAFTVAGQSGTSNIDLVSVRAV